MCKLLNRVSFRTRFLYENLLSLKKPLLSRGREWNVQRYVLVAVGGVLTHEILYLQFHVK